MKHPSDISVRDYHYDLPEDRIAAYPLEQRDQSRLLVFKNDTIHEDHFANIGASLPPSALLVFNTTRVIQARLHFTNLAGNSIEVFCLEPSQQRSPGEAMGDKGSTQWQCLVGHLRRWKEEILTLTAPGLTLRARLLARGATSHAVELAWEPGQLTFAEVLQLLGQIPIPPYLKRNSEEVDRQRYQTVYASAEGSVAAPTAGLHFTETLLNNLRQAGVSTAGVTLHVSAGTFLPVKSERMRDHNMHGEWIGVEATVLADLLARPVEQVIAVGTTSLRTLETLYWMGVKAKAQPQAPLNDLEVGQWDPYHLSPLPREESLRALLLWMSARQLSTLICKTHILIAPPYQLKMAAGLVTNFHQPQSTLLLLVAAIVGDQWREIYTYALRQNFRFLSYGDSSLLLKESRAT